MAPDQKSSKKKCRQKSIPNGVYFKCLRTMQGPFVMKTYILYKNIPLAADTGLAQWGIRGLVSISSVIGPNQMRSLNPCNAGTAPPCKAYKEFWMSLVSKQTDGKHMQTHILRKMIEEEKKCTKCIQNMQTPDYFSVSNNFSNYVLRRGVFNRNIFYYHCLPESVQSLLTHRWANK